MATKQFEVVYQRTSEVVKYKDPQHIPNRSVIVTASSRREALEVADEVPGRVVLTATPILAPKVARKAKTRNIPIQPETNYSAHFADEEEPLEEALEFEEPEEDANSFDYECETEQPRAAFFRGVAKAAETRKQKRSKYIRIVLTVLVVAAVFIAVQWKAHSWSLSGVAAVVVSMACIYFIYSPLGSGLNVEDAEDEVKQETEA